MITPQELPLRKRLNNYALTGLLLAIMTYFIYHAVSGDRGYIALIQLRHERDHLEQKKEERHEERLRLEHKVSLLRNESLDLDLVDEEVRRSLGFVSPDEEVYMFKEQSNELSSEQ